MTHEVLTELVEGVRIITLNHPERCNTVAVTGGGAGLGKGIAVPSRNPEQMTAGAEGMETIGARALAVARDARRLDRAAASPSTQPDTP